MMIAAISVLISAPGYGASDTAGKIIFRDVKVTPVQAIYLVMRDVNIRARPETKSKRVGSYKKGEKINVVGIYKGWVAVRENGKDVGFVYSSILYPVIDGKIDIDVVGKIDDGKRSCRYRLSYDGKNDVDGELFQTADYTTFWQCTFGAKKISLLTPVYLVEAALPGAKKNRFQMTLDVPDMDDGLEAVLSTNFLYLPAQFANSEKGLGKVVYDSVSMSKFAGKPKISQREVKDYKSALKAVVEIGFMSWNEKFWQEIVRLQNNP